MASKNFAATLFFAVAAAITSACSTLTALLQPAVTRTVGTAPTPTDGSLGVKIRVGAASPTPKITPTTPPTAPEAVASGAPTYPTPTPRPTGYTPDGTPSIRVITNQATDSGVFDLKVQFTAGLGSAAVLAVFNEYGGQEGINAWLELGPDGKVEYNNSLDRGHAGPPIDAGVPMILHDGGETYLLVSQTLGRRWYSPVGTGGLGTWQDGDIWNDMRFTFRWDPLGRSWVNLGFKTFRKERPTMGQAQADWQSAWADLGEKFFKPLTGREDFGLTVTDGSQLGKLTLRLPDDTIREVDISQFEQNVNQTIAEQWRGYKSAAPYERNGMIPTKHGWVCIRNAAFKGEKSPVYPFEAEWDYNHEIWVQKTGQTIWTKKVVRYFGNDPRGSILFYLEEIPGGQLSPFGEKDVVVLFGEGYSTTLMDEETLFK